MTFDLYLKTLIPTVAVAAIVIQLLGRTSPTPAGHCVRAGTVCYLHANADVMAPITGILDIRGARAPAGGTRLDGAE